MEVLLLPFSEIMTDRTTYRQTGRPLQKAVVDANCRLLFLLLLLLLLLLYWFDCWDDVAVGSIALLVAHMSHTNTYKRTHTHTQT